MKIAIDASRYKIKQPTGVERYSFEIINSVLKHFWNQKDHQFLLYSPADFHIEGGGSVRYKKRIIPFKRFWTQIRLSWAMFRENIDVLFIPSHVLPLIHPKLSVITIHDIAFKHSRRAYSFFQYHYLNWSTNFAVKNAARIIVPSMAVKKDLLKFYKCKSGKIEVIHHGSEEKKMVLKKKDNEEIKEFFKQYNFDPEKDNFMLFVGRLETKKNLERVVQAFKKFSEHHPSWRLVLAGKLGVGHKKIIKKFYKLKNRDKIVMPGYISEKEKQYLSEKCQFFVFPSLYEGFGLPALSAFFYEKAVILSDIPVFHEIADQAAYYVDPYKTDEISHAMLELAANEKMKKMLIGKGKDRLKRFSWTKAGEATGKLIETLISNG